MFLIFILGNISAIVWTWFNLSWLAPQFDFLVGILPHPNLNKPPSCTMRWYLIMMKTKSKHYFNHLCHALLKVAIYEMQKVCKNFLYPFLQQIGGFRNETKRKLEPHISIFGGLIVKKVGNSSGKIYYFPLIHFTIQSQKLFWFPTHGWENWIQIRDRQKRRTHSVSYFDGQIVVEQISFILFYFSSQPN